MADEQQEPTSYDLLLEQIAGLKKDLEDTKAHFKEITDFNRALLNTKETKQPDKPDMADLDKRFKESMK